MINIGGKSKCSKEISIVVSFYVGYSESRSRLRVSLAHPRDCHFAHVQWLPLSFEKPQTPFREILIMFMFVYQQVHIDDPGNKHELRR